MQNSKIEQAKIPAAGRMDIYAGIHKAVRAFLADTLARVARLDLDDRQEVAAATAQVRELLVFCTDHIAHENAFVHTAMEARQPGSADATAGDHVHHGETVAALLAHCDGLTGGTVPERQAAWQQLQRGLALFTGDNLLHMDVEETVNNAVLQACYSDAELVALHQRILASLSPQQMALSTRWLLIGSSPDERAQIMGGMRADAPPPAFDAMLGIARQCLAPAEWTKLATALAPQRAAA